MKKFGNFVVKARYWFFGIFLLFAVASIFMMQYVGTNYNMVEYLPDTSKTKISITAMEDEFGSAGTASVMISGVTKEQAQAYSVTIAGVEGVASAVFDGEDESCYNAENQKALVKVFLNSSDYSVETEETLERIETALSGASVDMNGSAVEAVHNRNATQSEMSTILLVAIVIVIAILFLTSRSYIEPLIFLIVIGVAILINMGTNLALGSISFITQSISSVMLIALEMDYSIVLLHRYREEKEKVGDSKLAMSKAISGSFMAVVASSLTVMAGLVALMFMDFSIGFDMGMVLAKGVFISVLAVIFFMPAIILMFDRLIERTAHRSFLPSMKGVGVFAKKARYVMPVLFLCVVVVAVCYQGNITFSYVVKSGAGESEVAKAEEQVELYFGKQNPLVVMLAKDDVAGQKAIADYIVAYKDESGEYIVNSKSALCLTGAYDELSAGDVVDLGLSESTVSSIFAGVGKDVSADKVYKIDVINYLIANDTVLVQDFTSFINNSYTQLFTEINKESAKFMYGLTDAQVAEVFGESDKVSNLTLINYVVENDLPAGESDAIASGYTKANTALSGADLQEKYYLSQADVATIFTLLGKDANVDVIKNYELVKLLKETDGLIGQFAGKMQQTFASSKQAFDDASVMLVGDSLSRMIFNINLAVDDETALKFVVDLEQKIGEVCGENGGYIVSNSYNVVGMAEVFESDKVKTDLITIVAILLIVMCAFRSLSIPILLVLTIQGAIWINLAINVVGGSSVFFVCYLLAMAIQMGATIDYGILLTDRYVFARRKQDKFEAIKTAIDKSFVTVITSGSILVFAAFCIHFLSSIPLIADIGLLIGRGSLISVITILFVLPSLLLVFDKIIEKTTIKTSFLPNSTKAVATAVGADASGAVALSGDDELEAMIRTQNEIISNQEMALKVISQIDIDDPEMLTEADYAYLQACESDAEEEQNLSKLDELRQKAKIAKRGKRNNSNGKRKVANAKQSGKADNNKEDK